MAFARTLATLEKTVKDIKRALFWVSFVTNIVLLVFYGIQIYLNINRLVYLILYSILGGITLILFIIFLIRNSNEKRKKDYRIKMAKHWVKFAKLFVNLIMIGVTVYEFSTLGAKPLQIIAFSFSLLSLIVLFVFELISFFFDRYFNMLKMSFQKDIEEIKEAPKKKFLGLFHVNKDKEEKQLTKKEQEIEDLKLDYLERRKERKAEKKRLRKEKRKALVNNEIEVIE